MSNTPPLGTGTGAGTPRTLERDIHVAATVIVGFLLTALAWQIAWDVTAHLAITYGGGGRLLSLRTPLFLVGAVLIWAGVVSYGAQIVGKSFRNVVFDRRNLMLAQWVLVACAVWNAIHVTIKKHIPEVIGGEIREYNLALALLIGAGILFALQRVYGAQATGGGATAHPSAGDTHAARGGEFVLYALLILAAVDLGFWGLRWFNRTVIPSPPPATQTAAQAPTTPPKPEFIATNRFGLALVKTVEEITVRAGERSRLVRVSPPAETASWGTWEANNLLVFLNGEPIPADQATTNRIVFNQDYSFSAKSNTVALWVATGLKKPNGSGN